MDRKKFERHVADALATIPRRFRKAMHNIAIVVEDEPAPDLLREMEIEPPDTLFGLYQGTPLTERGWGFGNTLPDRILLFQGPHEREAADEDDLIGSIGETLIHEIGHYFGLSEEEIEDIEENYWRAGEYAPGESDDQDEPDAGDDDREDGDGSGGGRRGPGR